MALASIGEPLTQRLGTIWSPKMAAKGASEQSKTFIWIHILTCGVALRRLGKDILWDKRFGLNKDTQNGFGLHWRIDGAAPWSGLGIQNGFQRRLHSEGKSSNGYVFSRTNWLRGVPEVY